MTADAFRRLALVVGCSAWAVALALVWVHVHWIAGVAALIAGPAGALLLTLEPAADVEPDPGTPDLAGLSRREIERRARAARDDDDG